METPPKIAKPYSVPLKYTQFDAHQQRLKEDKLTRIPNTIKENIAWTLAVNNKTEKDKKYTTSTNNKQDNKKKQAA